MGHDNDLGLRIVCASLSLAIDSPLVYTFLFADLAGYTALTEAHGDEHAADAAAEFFEAMRSLLADHGAEEVNAIGDALLVMVPTAHEAVRLAERMVCEYGVRHRSLGIRVGIHTGTAVQRGRDWFGSGVNVASRVADHACAGEVLLTSTTWDALGRAIEVRDRGAQRFKNVAQPIALCELVLTAERSPVGLPIDPVCRMAVDPSLAVAREAYGDADFHFCSQECWERFAADPACYAEARSAP